MFRRHDGTRTELSGFGKTKRDAEERLQQQLDQHRVRAADTLTGKTLLIDAGQQWLDRIQRPDSDLSARSVDDYSRTFRRYIDTPGSTLRGLTLAEADDPARITGFLRGVADHHGNGAVKQCRVVLRHIFAMAVQHRALKTSPMRDVDRVRATKPKDTPRDTSRAFTREERDAVMSFAYGLADADKLNPRSRRKRQAVADLIAFLAGTGVRIAEARALRWDDLDLDAGTVLVRGTKTTSALRQNNLAPWLADRLRQRAERVGTTGLVFASPAHFHNETPWDQSNSANAINDVLRDAGYEWATPHTFRHSVVTELHNQGVPLHKIADWVGHSDVVVTSRYLGRDLGSDKSDLAALL